MSSGDHVQHLTSGGIDRRYLLHVAARIERDRPAPLVLMFHPGYSSAAQFAELTGMSAAAGEKGFLVAYPEGYRRSWNAGDCCGPPQQEGVDDVAFTAAVIADIEKRWSVDPGRVYAAGFSNGGGLVYRLACELSERIAAIAVAASPLHIPPASCRPSRPVSVLHFHGLADPVAPVEGGRGVVPDVGNQQAAQAAIDTWVKLDGCEPRPRTVLQRGAARAVTYPGCEPGVDVTLCLVEGMGHKWPGAPGQGRERFGPQSYDISATDMTVTFFEEHRRV